MALNFYMLIDGFVHKSNKIFVLTVEFQDLCYCSTSARAQNGLPSPAFYRILLRNDFEVVKCVELDSSRS